MRTSALRLSVLYAAIFAAALVALVFTIYLFTSRFIDGEMDEDIDGDVASLLEAFQRGGARQLAGELELHRGNWGRSNAVYLLVDRQGSALAGNLSAWPVMQSRSDRWVGFEILTREGDREVSHPVRAQALQLADGYRLLVGTNLSERQQLTRRFAVAAGVGAVLVTLLALWVGYQQSRRIYARVEAISRSCAEILAGNPGRRLPLAGADDEFDTLAREVNELLDRLARTTEILRASLHSAAHDLRSPMHRMRLRMEQSLGAGPGPAERENTEVLLRDLEHMQRVLTALLQIAEAESGAVGARPEEVALDVMLAELGELFEPQAEERAIAFRLELAPGLRVLGHRQLLAQAAANLIENALKFTPPGGQVLIRSERADGRLLISVADSGPGIPVADRARAVAPFVRLGNDRDTARGGAGLGLSLAAAVARLHGGTLRLEDNQPGLRVLLELPAAA